MDTKMKLPPLSVNPCFGDYGVFGADLVHLTEAEAHEVKDRCNAAPKLVEAIRKLLERRTRLDDHDGVLCVDAELAELSAILKETGAEK